MQTADIRQNQAEKKQFSCWVLVWISFGCVLSSTQKFTLGPSQTRGMRHFFLQQQQHRLSRFLRATPSWPSHYKTTAVAYLSLFPVCSASKSHPFQRKSISSKTNTMETFDNKRDDEDRQYTEYERIVRKLYQINLFNPVNLGLENTIRLHELLGNPLDNVTVVHVAGSNGKGSVTMKIAKAIEAAPANLRVGMFVSPHVSSFRERMQINGKLITEEQVLAYLPRVFDICEQHNIAGTFFEITALLAFLFFKEENVDVVVLETGLGGRLDATNIVSKPALSVITSIGLEHTRILGDTIEKIALEKGGIIKKGCPVLCGPHVPHEVLRKCAREKQASTYLTCDDVLGNPGEVITDYDKENARIAESALSILQENGVIPKLTPEMVQQGVSRRPPCRFELVKNANGVEALLDVAHNPPAMEYLIRKLIEQYPDKKYRFVVGMSADKDMGQCARSILDVTSPSSVHVVEAQHPRAAKIEDILEAAPVLKNEGLFDLEDRSIMKQVHDALKIAKEKNEILVICGSVFLMAEAREALGFDEPRDSECIAEMAGANIRNLRNSQENFGYSK
mmetsp:Transcript_12159/g.18851  ORF Transcript_12159/g.18851 Transcript_12159/m.18851 type:complete len:565 (-) Transcript_12159:117-1811(-)